MNRSSRSINIESNPENKRNTEPSMPLLKPSMAKEKKHIATVKLQIMMPTFDSIPVNGLAS